MAWDCKEFLFQQVGVEEPKQRRINLFRKLVRLYERHGLAVGRIIAEVWAEACELVSPSKPPSHYFAKTVKLRLMEHDLWHESKRFDGCVSMEEILASGVFKQRSPLPLFPEKSEQPARDKIRHNPRCLSASCTGCA